MNQESSFSSTRRELVRGRAEKLLAKILKKVSNPPW